MTSEYTPPKFVTTGNDDLIKVWEMKDNNVHSCHVVATLEGHESAVRDAQWRPSYTGNLETIASGGDVLFFLDYQEGSLNIWVSANYNCKDDNKESNAAEWKVYELKKFDTPVTKIAWNENGNHLAVTTADCFTYLFKEDAENVWNLVAITNADGIMESAEFGKEDEENI